MLGGWDPGCESAILRSCPEFWEFMLSSMWLWPVACWIPFCCELFMFVMQNGRPALPPSLPGARGNERRASPAADCLLSRQSLPSSALRCPGTGEQAGCRVCPSQGGSQGPLPPSLMLGGFLRTQLLCQVSGRALPSRSAKRGKAASVSLYQVGSSPNLRNPEQSIWFWPGS